MFGERLKKLRSKSGITQEQLAISIGVERSSVGKYEGKQGIIPSVDVLNSIADYFDVSIDYLLGRTDIQSSPNANKERPTFEDALSELGVENKHHVKAIKEIVELMRKVENNAEIASEIDVRDYKGKYGT